MFDTILSNNADSHSAHGKSSPEDTWMPTKRHSNQIYTTEHDTHGMAI